MPSENETLPSSPIRPEDVPPQSPPDERGLGPVPEGHPWDAGTNAHTAPQEGS